MTRTPLTRENVLARLTAYLERHGAAPTAKQLADANGWKQADTALYLFDLRDAGAVIRNRETKTYSLRWGTPAAIPQVNASAVVEATDGSGQGGSSLPEVRPSESPLMRRLGVLVLVEGGGEAKTVLLRPYETPPAAGDDWAQYIQEDGLRRVRLWRCYETLRLNSGRLVCMMAAPEQTERVMAAVARMEKGEVA